ncbi:His-Xaa-Ser system radical SAM maturase HxsC [Novosphingopyxis sp.]|uniref:His-Xaa-Ser system radical SAM maturase HxsC n=1 Tax=Novosphingopyxis sp. TaxID=2709690 RepID=UPI003B5C9500
MIPLSLNAVSDARAPFISRLTRGEVQSDWDSRCISVSADSSVWCGDNGLFELSQGGENLAGDIILIDPHSGRADRLIRSGSPHNTLLVTEQCDQLCVMCSQPPKKSHNDRFALLTQACLLAPDGMTIGISGGEPTLHMEPLLTMVETVLANRSDLSFHILTNAQHFEPEHILRLQKPDFRRLVWGIPLYSADPVVHDMIVAKPGAFERLVISFERLLMAGARIELRTVLTATNFAALAQLSRFVVQNLPHIEQWSLMGLENIGFARNKWSDLYVDIAADFGPLAAAIDRAQLHGIAARLFNIPLCHVPTGYRSSAVASISDWKQRFGASCEPCRAKADCSGFFEWHPDELVEKVTPL